MSRAGASERKCTKLVEMVKLNVHFSMTYRWQCSKEFLKCIFFFLLAFFKVICTDRETNLV